MKIGAERNLSVRRNTSSVGPNNITYTITVELPEAQQGNPPLATIEQQQRVITDVLPLFNPPEIDTILQGLREGWLTTECTINGTDVSFVLRPIEEQHGV